MKKKAVIIVFIGVFGVSLSAIFGKLTTANGLITAMYRMFFTSLMLLPVFLAKHLKEVREAGRRTVLLCIVSGLFLGVHFWTYLESLKQTSIASSLVLVNTEVLFVAVLSFIFFREKLNKYAYAAIAIAIAGSIVTATAKPGGAQGSIILGDLLALTGAFVSSFYTIIGKRERSTLSTTAYTYIVYTSAAALLFVAALATGQKLGGYPAMDYIACFVMAVFCTLLGHSLFSYALKYVSAAFVSIAKLGEPVLSSVLAVFVFSETPVAKEYIGAVLVLSGILLYLRKGMEQ